MSKDYKNSKNSVLEEIFKKQREREEILGSLTIKELLDEVADRIQGLDHRLACLEHDDE